MGAYFVAQDQIDHSNFSVDGPGILKFAVDFIKAFTSEQAPQPPNYITKLLESEKEELTMRS